MSDEVQDEGQEVSLITLTFTSEDSAFKFERVMTLDQAQQVAYDLLSEVASARAKYNTPEVNTDGSTE